MGCFVSKFFSGTIVQSFHSKDYLTICFGSKVSIFRKILANKPIGVFIQPPFITSVWMSKIKGIFQALCDFLMLGKLFPIIRYRLNNILL